MDSSSQRDRAALRFYKHDTCRPVIPRAPAGRREKIRPKPWRAVGGRQAMQGWGEGGAKERETAAARETQAGAMERTPGRNTGDARQETGTRLEETAESTRGHGRRGR